jgi:hypothetical protein
VRQGERAFLPGLLFCACARSSILILRKNAGDPQHRLESKVVLAFSENDKNVRKQRIPSDQIKTGPDRGKKGTSSTSSKAQLGLVSVRVIFRPRLLVPFSGMAVYLHCDRYLEKPYVTFQKTMCFTRTIIILQTLPFACKSYMKSYTQSWSVDRPLYNEK